MVVNISVIVMWRQYKININDSINHNVGYIVLGIYFIYLNMLSYFIQVSQMVICTTEN